MLSEVAHYRDETDTSTPKEDEGLRLFVEGSGFKRATIKQVFGEEFKFILNDYPDVCKAAVLSSEVRTVKLRIYKVFH